MDDHNLLIALAHLYSALKGSSVEKYAHFHHTMGPNCPYTLKAAKMFSRRDKSEILKRVQELIDAYQEPNE